MYDLLYKLFIRLGLSHQDAIKAVDLQRSHNECPNELIACQRRKVTFKSIMYCNQYLNEVCSNCSSKFFESVLPCGLPQCKEAFNKYLSLIQEAALIK